MLGLPRCFPIADVLPVNREPSILLRYKGVASLHSHWLLPLLLLTLRGYTGLYGQ